MMGKTKILFLTNNLGTGGAERVLVNLANRMAEDGYEITVRCLADNGDNRRKLSPKVTYEYVFRHGFRGENYLYLLPHRYIYKKVAHGTFDVIIPYMHGVLTKIVSYAPKSQNTIAYLHANMEKSEFMDSFHGDKNIRRCFSCYDRIVSVSEDVQRSFEKRSGIRDGRLTVKYNTFDVETILSMSKEESEINRSEYGVLLCSVGKLESVKGYGRLLSTVKQLVREGFDIRLQIIGEGEQREELEDYIERNGLQNNIRLVGLDSNPYKYMAKSDLYVCSSESEGFSSTVAESLILGIPVLTTDCAGMREMLGGNGEYGMIVENSTDGLYNGLKKILTEQGLLAHYKEQSQKRSGFFAPERTVKEVEKMIDEVLNE